MACLMMYFKKNSFLIVIVFFVLIFTLVFCIYRQSTYFNYTYSPYEQEVINHFKEVALKTEYGDNPQRIVKWKSVMYLYPMLNGKSIKSGQCIEQLAILRKTIKTINLLADNNFKIILTDDAKKSNSLIYFTSQEKMNEMFPDFFVGIEEKVAGLTKGYWKNYYLYKTEIFIDIDESLEVQESAILEEISQSIGLPNDTKKHSNSVFYQNKSNDNTTVTDFSSLDKDVIQLLYHPKIKAGLDAKQVENEILKILKNREIKLYGSGNVISQNSNSSL